jgi:hypothetical protein
MCDHELPNGKLCRRPGYCWQHGKHHTHQNQSRFRRNVRSIAAMLLVGIASNLLTPHTVPDFITGLFKSAPTGRSYSVSLQDTVPTHDAVFQAGVPITATTLFPTLQGTRLQDFVAPAPSWTKANSTVSGFSNVAAPFEPSACASLPSC